MKKIKKILIANRSEIVSRINATCKSLDIKTVAIYSPEDKFLKYIFQTDERYPLSKNGYTAYLNQDEIIEIAIKTQADAIHPGYGFLSENYEFAQKVIDAGILWIGPAPETIKLMGNKICARNILSQTEVPVVPGFYLTELNYEIFEKIKKEIGYPIILKDPNGGGGKAIKIINSQQELQNYFYLIKEEVKKLTGSQELLLEKYIQNGKHIEIQIAGDSKNFVHFYERDCSIQRRHQKIIEETPCNFIATNILEKMYDMAILTARTINYKNIGTVEFIVTQDRDTLDTKFYFLEVNTRLQVEHSVTEMTTDIDLVALQIEIAQTDFLKYKQEEISRKNHAIECRIYAENPDNNFMPCTGQVINLNIPQDPFLRIDHNLQEDQEINSFFDPMIAKVTVVGQDRDCAISKMLYVLEQFNISGIQTNINFLKKILKTEKFLTGDFDTQSNLSCDLSPVAIKAEREREITIAQIAANLFQEIINKKNNFKKNKNTNNNWRNQLWE
ncbi:ATP-grasp domain-containing protein [Candidatus Babeliales bacterium]|nr:ATP-grasp domain-containing protein [Candidatus Babeliales bacterium]